MKLLAPRLSARPSPSRFQRRAALLFITLDSLFTSGLKRLFLQLPSASSAHFCDLEPTAACLDIKQIQTLGAAAASAAGNHLENYHTSLDSGAL